MALKMGIPVLYCRLRYNSPELVDVTFRATYAVTVFFVLSFSRIPPPFSACDIPGISSQPHPEEEDCRPSYKLVWAGRCYLYGDSLFLL